MKLLHMLPLLGMVVADLPALTGSTNTSTLAPSTSKSATLTTLAPATDLPSITQTTQTITQAPAAMALMNQGDATTSTFATPEMYIPSGTNKYMQMSSLPNGTVFIAVGGAIGFVLFVVLSMWFFTRMLSNRRARQISQWDEKNYYYQPMMFSDTDSSASSYDEIKSNHSALIAQENAGRTFRNALNGNNRRSMFISPTEYLQNTSMDSSDSTWKKPHSRSSSIMLLDEIEDYKPFRPPSMHMDMMFDSDNE